MKLNQIKTKLKTKTKISYKMIKFTYPGKLPTLNEFISANNKNRYKAANIKHKYTYLVAFQARKQLPVNYLTGQYDLIITWYVPNNKSDSDNVFFAVKFILDGLILAKRLQNDSRKFIRNISNIIITDKSIGYKTEINFIQI